MSMVMDSFLLHHDRNYIFNFFSFSVSTTFFFFFSSFCLFAFAGVAPVAYGGSQAKGLIEAVAAGLHQSHSNAGSQPLP